jgi:hypothetical protein
MEDRHLPSSSSLFVDISGAQILDDDGGHTTPRQERDIYLPKVRPLPLS